MKTYKEFNYKKAFEVANCNSLTGYAKSEGLHVFDNFNNEYGFISRVFKDKDGNEFFVAKRPDEYLKLYTFDMEGHSLEDESLELYIVDVTDFSKHNIMVGNDGETFYIKFQEKDFTKYHLPTMKRETVRVNDYDDFELFDCHPATFEEKERFEKHIGLVLSICYDEYMNDYYKRFVNINDGQWYLCHDTLFLADGDTTHNTFDFGHIKYTYCVNLIQEWLYKDSYLGLPKHTGIRPATKAEIAIAERIIAKNLNK